MLRNAGTISLLLERGYEEIKVEKICISSKKDERALSIPVSY